MTYHLTDGEASHAAHPATFDLPDGDERGHLFPGCLAKLIFTFDGYEGGERMWVKVTSVTTGGYVGTLANNPAFLPLEFGDVVRFESKHVIDITI